MKTGLFPTLLFGLWALCSQGVWAQWETIQTGFEYQQFNVAGPVEVFVVRLDRGDVTTRAIDSMVAQGRLRPDGLANQGRETVSAMAARCDDTINYYQQIWGQRNEVVAAINGDFWERSSPGGPLTGYPTSGQLHGGWACRRYIEFSGGSGFFWTIFGVPHLGGDVVNGGNAARQRVQFDDLSETNIDAVNVPRAAGEMTLYTPQFGPSTFTADGGVEVIVQMDRPNVPLPPDFFASGTIVAVNDGPGNAPIFFDQIVLSATGADADTLRAECVTGEALGVRMYIRDYGLPTTPALPVQDWTKAYGGVGGDREVVIEGQIPTNTWPTTRDPRTAVGFNDTHAFFVVADGRRSGSIGFSFQELGGFFLNTLSATHAIALDGGGSSALWVQGRGIVNQPSDGSERATHNGLMMVSVHPKVQSTMLQPSDSVFAQTSLTLRLGPGDNHEAIGSAAQGVVGTVLDHDLAGVMATGDHWWLCDFEGEIGWAPASALIQLTGTSGFMLYD